MEDVCERLTQHGQIDASDISVDVDNGEITLTGSVDSRRTKRMVEDTVESIPGVTDIHNQLHVSQSQAQGRGGQRAQRSRIHEGMEVTGSDGSHVGNVTEVRSRDFLVHRDTGQEIYVPFSKAQISGDQITLDVPANQVESQGWKTPGTVGKDQEKQRR
jgi:hypothetical protein